jgi:hypothetical protein
MRVPGRFPRERARGARPAPAGAGIPSTVSG